MGSKENLKSPQSPIEGQVLEWGPPGSSRKNSLSIDTTTNRRLSVQETSTTEHQQTTSEMFKDLLSQKRNMFLSKLTSFDSDVSKRFFLFLFEIWYFIFLSTIFGNCDSCCIRVKEEEKKMQFSLIF